MGGACSSSTDVGYLQTCIPRRLSNGEINPNNTARYRKFMVEWIKGNPDYQSSQQLLFGVNQASDYWGKDTGVPYSGEREPCCFFHHGLTGATYSYGAYNEMIILNYQTMRERMKNTMMITDDILDQIWFAFYWPYESSLGKQLIDNIIATVNPGMFAEDYLKRPRDTWIQTHFCLLNEPDMGNIQWDNTWTGNLGLTKPTQGSDWKHVWGDPLWTQNERDYATRMIFPDWDGENFLDHWLRIQIETGQAPNDTTYEKWFGPQIHPGAANPAEGTPGYSGNLPYAPPFLHPELEPWHPPVTDPNAEGYKDPCINKTILETYVPIAAGAVGAVVGATIVPGDLASASAAVTLGGAAYSVVSSTYGFAAWERENISGVYPGDPKDMAPVFLGVGVPVTGGLLLDQLGLMPESLQNQTMTIVAIAGAGGYFLITPFLTKTMKIGDSIATELLTPLSLIDKGITQLFNGCFVNRITTIGACRCSDAIQKPATINAMLVNILGTTGDQTEMRTTCLEAAMDGGLWGDDPKQVGMCKDNGTQTNPAACIQPGAWIYKNFGTDPLAQGMYDQISHCIDKDNPSFLPPRDIDAPCAKYGDAFRLVDGVCQNMRAPKGKRGPGQYTEETTNTSSCIIF